MTIETTFIETPYGNVYFPVEPLPGVNGVSLSGGADSALLLYLLASRGLVPDRVFYIDQTAGSNDAATKKVLALVNKKCGTKMKLEKFKRVGTDHSLKPDLLEMGLGVDYLWIGVTALPPEDVVLGGLYPNRPKKRESSNVIYRYMEPFRDYDKRAVLWLYDHLGLQDLFKLTWSCSTSQTEACQTCFNCTERDWAVKSFNPTPNK